MKFLVVKVLALLCISCVIYAEEGGAVDVKQQRDNSLSSSDTQSGISSSQGVQDETSDVIKQIQELDESVIEFNFFTSEGNQSNVTESEEDVLKRALELLETTDHEAYDYANDKSEFSSDEGGVKDLLDEEDAITEDVQTDIENNVQEVIDWIEDELDER